MSSIIKVDTIQDQSGNNIINESGDTITIGAAGDTVDVPGTEVKTNKVSPTSGTSLQIGDSGDTVNVVGTLQNNGSALVTGKILQVVSTTKTSTFQTSSASMVDVTGFSAAITPASTSNKIYVMVTCGTFINDNGNARALMQVLRGSTNITAGDAATGEEVGAAICGRTNDGAHHQFATVISILDQPNTTSETTYKVQVSRGPDAAGVVNLNRSGNQDSNSGNTISTLTLMEVSA